MEKDIDIFTLSLACEKLNAEEMGRLLQALINYCYAKEDEEHDKDDIAEELAGLGVAVHRNVYDDRARLYHVARYEPRAARRNHEDIRLTGHFGKVGGAPVAVDNGAVFP